MQSFSPYADAFSQMHYEIKYNNCAGRLLAMLEYARTSNSQGQAYQVLAEVLNQEPKSANFYRLIVQYHGLFSMVCEQIKIQKPTNYSNYIGIITPIESALEVESVATRKWNDVKSNCLTSAAMDGLTLCASELQVDAPIEREELNGLRGEVIALFDLIHSSSLPEPLKESLLRQLKCIIDELLLYSIHGVDRISDALSYSMGEMLRHKSLVQTADAEIEGNNWKAIIVQVFKSIGNFVQLAKAGTGLYLECESLGEDINKIIGNGNDLTG